MTEQFPDKILVTVYDAQKADSAAYADKILRPTGEYIRADLLPCLEDLNLISRLLAKYQNEIGSLSNMLYGSKAKEHDSLLSGDLAEQYDRIEMLHFKVWRLTERLKKQQQ